MARVLTPEQWAALRALAEGEPPTHSRLASAVDVHPSTLTHRAAGDGWRGLDFRHLIVRVLHAFMVDCSAAIRAGRPLPPAPREAFGDAANTYGAQARPPDDGTDGSGETFGSAEKDEAALARAASLPQAERLGRVAAILAGRIETLLIGVEAGAELDPKQVTALSALVQLAERIAGMGEQQAAATAMATDREIAEAIGILDAQILRHAHAEARRLLIEEFGQDPAAVDARLPPVT